jgi:putative drug exporter of the RND superfamily
VGDAEKVKESAAKAPGVATFRRLGRFTVKRSRVIIAFWVALFALSLPLALNVSDVVSSGSGGFDLPGAESVRAGDILDLQFPRAFDNSSAIIVIEAANVTDSATQRFVLDLESRVTAQGAQPHLTNFTSIYSVERKAITETAIQVAPLLYSANFSAFVVWGVPSIFLGNWLATDPNLTVAQRDFAANNSTAPSLTSFVSTNGLDNDSSAMAFGYYASFYSAWAASEGNATQVADPPSRAAAAVRDGAAAFAASIPDPQRAFLLVQTAQSFNLTSWSEESALHAFVNGQVASFGLSPLPSSFLRQVASLGPAPNRSAAEALARSTVENGSLATFPVKLPAQAVGAFVARDNETMIAIAGYDKSPSGFGDVESDPILVNVRHIRENITDLKGAQGAPPTVLVTGNAATTLDASESNAHSIQRIEPATILAIVLLVSLFFAAAFVVGVPLGSIIFALFITEALVYLIGKFLVHIPDTTLTFLFTIILGVGIDYAVFIMARYREERAAGADRETAVETAVTWAGESIATSGATVIIAFAILALGSFEFLQAMGFAVGLGVTVALAVSITLIPALLRLLGNRIFWPTSGDRFDKRLEAAAQRKRDGYENYFRRAAKFSVKHAKLVVLIAVIISVPTTYISLTSNTSYDFIAGLPDVESSHGIDAMKDAFGGGQLGPTQVLLVFPSPVANNTSFDSAAYSALDEFAGRLANLSNVRTVEGPSRPKGVDRDPLNPMALSASERADIAPYVGKDNRTVLIVVVFADEPFTRTSMQTVREVRALSKDMMAQAPAFASTQIYVGGQSASTLDFADTMDGQFFEMRVLVVVAVYMILLMVLGSYLLPLSAVLSVTLSITWAFAATLLFFRNVLGHEVLFLVPLILFILLMGIGMDYNIFILTRIREESEKGKGPKEAAVDAVEATGGIISALALILAAALGSLMLSDNTLLQGFGFAIAFAVLLDAMVVRTYLVPAIMSLLGERAWWGPKRFRRVEIGGKPTEEPPLTE